MDIVKEFTTKLIMGLVKNPDIVKIQDFTDEDGAPILEIIVHSEDDKFSISRASRISCYYTIKWSSLCTHSFKSQFNCHNYPSKFFFTAIIK